MTRSAINISRLVPGDLLRPSRLAHPVEWVVWLILAVSERDVTFLRLSSRGMLSIRSLSFLKGDLDIIDVIDQPFFERELRE